MKSALFWNKYINKEKSSREVIAAVAKEENEPDEEHLHVRQEGRQAGRQAGRRGNNHRSKRFAFMAERYGNTKR